MAVFLGAFPVLPGKTDEARRFAAEALARREEFAASQKRGEITREEWSLQETEMGATVIVRFEAPDVEKAFEVLGASTDEFDVWFRQRVKDVSGVDMAEGSPGPLPEILLDWSA